jgi:ABC-type multidrug transport system ATPase subunit
MNRKGATVIYTSHYMEEVSRSARASRSWIRQGRRSGTSNELKNMIKQARRSGRALYRRRSDPGGVKKLPFKALPISGVEARHQTASGRNNLRRCTTISTQTASPTAGYLRAADAQDVFLEITASSGETEGDSMFMHIS